MKKINVFWTGGLDSTYRILELSTIPDIEIQPYYIKFKERHSAFKELFAINKITDIIRNLPNYNGHLLNIKVYNTKDFKYYDDIHQSRIDYKKQGHNLGYQYCYCADLCRFFDIKCEVSLENERTCGGHYALKHFTTLAEDEFDYYIDKEKTDNKELVNIFENILFPKTVFNKTKREEINYIKSIESKILNYIVFCYKIKFDGKLCGECSPCKSYKKLGLFDEFNGLFKLL